MPAKRYDSQTREAEIARWWQEHDTYAFEPEDDRPVFSIDTPPPTVSGKLHLGHIFHYSHADFIARFRRMRGANVFYPMGYDDNGLPTEQLVEKLDGVYAGDMVREQGRAAFAARCNEVSEATELAYRRIWERLGLSIDWRYTYRTIDEQSRRTAQWAFLNLLRRELAYRAKAPAIWCPHCRTAIAQAEVDDLERESTFFTIAFTLDDGDTLPIATTRPELLPACVAVFIHPDDPRKESLAGREATVPLFGRRVPILVDQAADPTKGTGLVMCCTFGDTQDVAWQRSHGLPVIEAIGPDGRMLAAAGPFGGLTTAQARREIVLSLGREGALLGSRAVRQTVRTHERCDTPVEYILTQQWFVRVLEHKQALLAAGERIAWHPAHMQNRYRQWVENLSWDWCVSRRRFYGVPFPLWHCAECGAFIPADEAELPVNPMERPPGRPCPSCGSEDYLPETDVMDTWATSSLSPQIVGRFFADPALYQRLTPFSMRPQAHEIIRTWAFYTIAQAHFHFDALPWRTTAISGWALAPSGSAKISKSKGGGPAAPEAMMDRYSADALRYWAAGAGLGKDAAIDEERIQAGQKLVTKLWNVARFCARFLHGYAPPSAGAPTRLTPADRWILARAARLSRRLAAHFEGYDYASARSELEQFFWRDLADNYLEMAKKRLYDGGQAADGALFTLHTTLLAVLKFFAPLLPYITEAVYQEIYERDGSIHRTAWPETDGRLSPAEAGLEAAGEALLSIATAVRRFKSERNLGLAAEVAELQVAAPDERLGALLQEAVEDLQSITRARRVVICAALEPGVERPAQDGGPAIAIRLQE